MAEETVVITSKVFSGEAGSVKDSMMQQIPRTGSLQRGPEEVESWKAWESLSSKSRVAGGSSELVRVSTARLGDHVSGCIRSQEEGKQTACEVLQTQYRQ